NEEKKIELDSTEKETQLTNYIQLQDLPFTQTGTKEITIKIKNTHKIAKDNGQKMINESIIYFYLFISAFPTGLFGIMFHNLDVACELIMFFRPNMSSNCRFFNFSIFNISMCSLLFKWGDMVNYIFFRVLVYHLVFIFLSFRLKTCKRSGIYQIN
ncbi:hypothetical protein L9F63_022724, partial [Diploptera punctata]